MSRRAKRVEILSARLDRDNYTRFVSLAAKERCTKTQLVRDALLFFLKNRDLKKSEESDSRYIEALKKSTNRICSLLAKLALDTSTLAHFMHANMDEYGKEQFKEAHLNAIKRVKARVNRIEAEIAQGLIDNE